MHQRRMAKKAAKEAEKVRIQQKNLRAKEGEPFINLLIYFSTPFNLFSQLYVCVQVLLPGPHVGGPQSAIIAGRGKIIFAIVLKLVFPLI